jgi:hypothetical protein
MSWTHYFGPLGDEPDGNGGENCLPHDQEAKERKMAELPFERAAPQITYKPLMRPHLLKVHCITLGTKPLTNRPLGTLRIQTLRIITDRNREFILHNLVQPKSSG